MLWQTCLWSMDELQKRNIFWLRELEETLEREKIEFKDELKFINQGIAYMLEGRA